MSAKQKSVTDLLFLIQVVCTLIFGGGQFLRMLHTTQGVSPTWWVFWELFLLLNLGLAIKAHQAQPSRVTRQTLASYLLWTVMVTANLAVIVSKGSASWNHNDSICAVFVGFMAVVVFAAAGQKHYGIADPIVRGWLAIAFKAIPQLVMAWNIWVHGGGGLAWTTVLAGHITVLTRLGQLVFAIREAGWDRNRKGSALSEIGNELSWTVTTIAWLSV